MLPSLCQLLPQPLHLDFQPLQPGIRLAHPGAEVIGLEAKALGFNAPVPKLRLELLDDVGGGILGHAPQEAFAATAGAVT